MKDIKPKYICTFETPVKNYKYHLDVVSCEKLKEEDPKNTYIIITNYNDFDKTRIYLEQNGFYNYCMSCIYIVMPIMNSMKSIIKLWDCLYDDISKVVLKEILKTRIKNLFLYPEKISENNPIKAPACCFFSDGKFNEALCFGKKRPLETYICCDSNVVNIHQYFSDEEDPYLKLGENEVFVDVGACLGETTVQFMEVVNNQFKKIYMFEPDVHNLQILEENDFFKNDKISIMPVGLSCENKILSFSQDGTMLSKIDEDGTEEIKVVKMDDVIKEAITYIKMDIEGAEIDALYGAKEIIKRDKPKCAISIYHKVTDLWQIPLLLKEWVPEYKILIRQHTNIWADTVLYAYL